MSQTEELHHRWMPPPPQTATSKEHMYKRCLPHSETFHWGLVTPLSCIRAEAEMEGGVSPFTRPIVVLCRQHTGVSTVIMALWLALILQAQSY